MITDTLRRIGNGAFITRSTQQALSASAKWPPKAALPRSP
jgi:hypothetical protein